MNPSPRPPLFRILATVAGVATLMAVPAVRTGWLIGLTPIWSAVLATVFLGEGFGRRKVVGLIIGAVGTLVLITRGALSLGVLALPAMLIPFFVGAAGWQE